MRIDKVEPIKIPADVRNDNKFKAQDFGQALGKALAELNLLQDKKK